MPKKARGTTIKGIRFRLGEVDWEDAHGITRGQLPDFEAMQQEDAHIGTKITSTGLVARIGKYLVVITEKNDMDDEYDYTVIPLHAKIQIRYL